jgi:hypothetical protein
MLWGMKNAFLLILLLLLSATPVVAGVYKWVDASGQVHFSDQPVDGAEKVVLPEPTVYSPRPLPGEEDDQQEQGATPGTPYTRFAVVRPSDNETIWDNEGNVKVSLDIQPPLSEGHKFQVFLDGASVGELATAQITLQNVDRGTRTVSAAVVDQGGIELGRTAPVTFHLRQTTLFDPDLKPENPIERPPYEPPPFPDFAPVNPPDVTLPVEPPEPENPIAPEPGGGDDGEGGDRRPTAPQGGPYTPNFAPNYRPTFNPRPAAR